jgi:hypothetical protein
LLRGSLRELLVEARSAGGRVGPEYLRRLFFPLVIFCCPELSFPVGKMCAETGVRPGNVWPCFCKVATCRPGKLSSRESSEESGRLLLICRVRIRNLPATRQLVSVWGLASLAVRAVNLEVE